MNKAFLGVTILLVSMFFSSSVIAEGLNAGPNPGDLEMGRAQDGSYIIPSRLAQECKIKMSDAEAPLKFRECILNLLDERSNNVDRMKEIDDLFADAVNESRVETLIDLVAEKIYSAKYEADVVEEFKKNMASGETVGGLGTEINIPSSGGDGGGAEATDVQMDWMNIAQADKHIASISNAHLNHVLALGIMYKALENINIMDASYLEKK